MTRKRSLPPLHLDKPILTYYEFTPTLEAEPVGKTAGYGGGAIADSVPTATGLPATVGRGGKS
ncbi:MAG: hypothetical protein E3J21_03750 [Anaerolineales bacterium]|nr:MAG: hypothetical protein E3J21_03750 [Anaerolineales bacterium]